jgi:hypothetical protein
MIRLRRHAVAALLWLQRGHQIDPFGQLAFDLWSNGQGRASVSTERHARMRVCIASCVFLSNLASFFSISRFKSQLGRFGAMLNTSCLELNMAIHILKAQSYQLLLSALFVISYNLFSQSRYVFFDSVLHDFIFLRMFSQCSSFGVEIPSF